MSRPSLPSMLMLVLSLCALTGAWAMRTPTGTTIDRSFLKVLCSIPEDIDARAATGIDFDAVAGQNEAALTYLWSTKDPEAVRAVVRCTMADLCFGGCSCTKGQTYSTFFWDGTPSSFWEALGELHPEAQAQVLATVQGFVRFEPDWWFKERDDFLFARDETAERLKDLLPEQEESNPAEAMANANTDR